MDEGIKKNVVYIHSEYYSVIKKNEIMSFAGKWVGPEIITVSKISQTEKDKHHVFSLIWNLDLKK
jgi:hypothetical protein